MAKKGDTSRKKLTESLLMAAQNNALRIMLKQTFVIHRITSICYLVTKMKRNS